MVNGFCRRKGPCQFFQCGQIRYVPSRKNTETDLSRAKRKRTKQLFSRSEPRVNKSIVKGEAHLAADRLAVLESEEGVLVVVAMGSSDIDDLHIRILDQLLVGTVCLGLWFSADFLNELCGTVSAGGRSDGDDVVRNIRHIARRRVQEKVLGELFGDAASREDTWGMTVRVNSLLHGMTRRRGCEGYLPHFAVYVAMMVFIFDFYFFLFFLVLGRKQEVTERKYAGVD